MFRFITIISVLIFFQSVLVAQVAGDECKYAIKLPSVNNYCSEDGQFTNVGAKADPEFIEATNECVSLKWINGVWFSFIPLEPAVLIRIFGKDNGGTMQSPKVVLFKNCGEYLSCSPGNDIGTCEFVFDDLLIGHEYYFMVESSLGGEGTFKVCFESFKPVKSPEADCKNGVVLCDDSPFVVNSLTGVGNDNNEIDPFSCIQSEFASAWYKWTCDKPGTLTFVLTPNNNLPGKISDDLDFAIYELPTGLDDCKNKKMVRCEAGGANTDEFGQQKPLENWKNCNGPTGLAFGEKDTTEPSGCPTGSNNFLKPLDMEAGKSYVLVVNNYSRSGLGFGINFGGSGTFLGPKPDFEINANKAFECDKTVVISNKSVANTDSIVSYDWSFGDRSNPERANGKGPFNVEYTSFGNKTAALTVETSRGCVVTKILDFYVEACCKDTSTLKATANPKDLRCFEIPEGSILASGAGGAPEYKYSIDGKQFVSNPLFSTLKAGNYNIWVQDLKGCEDSISIKVNQPEQLIADAGPDRTIELGQSTFLNGSYTPRGYNVKQYWTPNYNLVDSSDFKTEAYPYKTTKYTLTVVQDSTGCTDTDDMTVFVIANREVRIPNVFSPNDDGYNDYFTAYNVKAGVQIDELMIFDRWGELIFDKKNIPLGDHYKGWNGRFKGQKVNSGVYVYLIKVRFLDDEVINFAGDITVLN